MTKRLLFGGGLAGALAIAFLVGSLTLGGAFAQAPSPSPTAQPTAEATATSDSGQAEQQTTSQAPAEASSQAPAEVTADSGQSEQQPSYAGSITVPEDQQGQSEQDEAKALEGLAKVTADQAKAAALAQFPGATVGKVELDNENGSLVYSVQLTDASGKGQDVKVDAGNGKVLGSEADDAEGTESQGGAEDQGSRDKAGSED